MKPKLFLPFLVVALASCNGSGPTSPTTPEKPQTTTAPAGTVGTPTVVTPTTPTTPASWWEGGFTDGGGFHFTNLSADPLTWTVYSTSFDDQVTALQAITQTTLPASTFADSLNTSCRQVDAQQGVLHVGERATAAPFAHAYLDKAGKRTTAEAAVASCKPAPTPTPTPDPSPSPSPSPTPCPKSGIVTVRATTNAGNYKVYDGATIVWSGYLAVGGSASFAYAPNGHTLTFKHEAELIASVVAQCERPSAAWHGTIAYFCIGCQQD